MRENDQSESQKSTVQSSAKRTKGDYNIVNGPRYFVVLDRSSTPLFQQQPQPALPAPTWPCGIWFTALALSTMAFQPQRISTSISLNLDAPRPRDQHWANVA